jgi:hypothetical protein
LIPAVGFVIACTIFAGVGALALSRIPRLHLSLVNVVVFVIGAVPTSAFSAVAYGWVFANKAGELNPVAVLGLFAVLLVAGLLGGLLAVVVWTWLMRFTGSHRVPFTR